MAGGRLGFAFGSRELIADLDKIKYSTNPYNVNRLTLAAGEASIEDDAYYQKNCEEIRKTREYTAEKLREMGAVLTPSKTNFLFMKLPGIGGREAYEKLKAMGILVRHFDKDKIADYLRVTIGTKEQMNAFLNGVKSILTT